MNRMHRKKLSVAVINAVNAGVVVGLATPLAYAQQTPPPTAAEPQKIERIEVTGSRIPSPTLTSESPVNVINSQEIAYTGLTSTSEILNQLPQVTAGQGPAPRTVPPVLRRSTSAVSGRSARWC